jgi:hypothetical protein
MSDKYEVTGSIILIEEAQTFASGFTKRSFVIKTQEEKYPQDLKFDALKDDCARLDAFAVGDSVTVGFNLRGNEYQGKYYVSLQAWKFSKAGGTVTSPTPLPTPPKQPIAALSDSLDDEFGEDDDIPF